MKLRCITEQGGTATGGNQLAGDQAQHSHASAGAGTLVPGNPVASNVGTGDNLGGDTGSGMPDTGTAAPDTRMGTSPPQIDKLIVEPAPSYFLRRLNSKLRDRGLQEELELAEALQLIEDLPASLRRRVQTRIYRKTARKPRVPSPELKPTHTESDYPGIGGTTGLVAQDSLGTHSVCEPVRIGNYTNTVTPGLNDLNRRNKTQYGGPDYTSHHDSDNQVAARGSDPDREEIDGDVDASSIDTRSVEPDQTSISDVLDYVASTINAVGSVIGHTTGRSTGTHMPDPDDPQQAARECSIQDAALLDLDDDPSDEDLPPPKRRNTDAATAMEVAEDDLPDVFDEALQIDEYMDILLEAMT